MPEQRRRRQRKFRHSKLYSFACGRSSLDPAEQSQLGRPGFSRVVHANEPDLQDPLSLSFPSNSISTTKYNVITFLPKSLFEQFRRVANMYFLVTACLSYTNLAPYSSAAAVLPLALVILATMIKGLVEDWRRKQQVQDS
jgi:phospholipid-translocating ATPase